MEALQKELKDLSAALKNNTVTIDEYCSSYHAISQRIKNYQK
jgi:hypothetical protein